MGNIFQKLFDNLFNTKQEKRMLMLGLDAAGKTTMLYQMKLGETITTIPTIGFNVEEVQYKSLNMTLWDVGGQEKIRPLWRHYYRGSNALIWLVDSADTDRMEDACNELHGILCDPEFPADAPLLIYANKQDLPGALNAEQLSSKLSLDKLRRKWYIQPSVAKRGDGIYEGFEWLVDVMKKQKS